MSRFSIKPQEKSFKTIGSRHNSMTEICCAIFKYKNEIKSVEIIDLKFGSSLK